MYMYVSTQVIDRHVHRYIDRHTDSQRDRQTNRETDTYKQRERARPTELQRESGEGRGGRGGRGGLPTSRTVALSGKTRILNLEVCTTRMDKR